MSNSKPVAKLMSNVAIAAVCSVLLASCGAPKPDNVDDKLIRAEAAAQRAETAQRGAEEAAARARRPPPPAPEDEDVAQRGEQGDPNEAPVGNTPSAPETGSPNG